MNIKLLSYNLLEHTLVRGVESPSDNEMNQ